MNLLANVSLLLLPVITGLGSVLWARLIGIHPMWAMACNVIAYGSNGILFYIFRDQFVGTFKLTNNELAITFGVAILVTAATSFMWIFALKGTSLALVAFVEIAYPFFILLFMAMLYGGVRMNFWHTFGAGAIMLGAILVVIGNIKSHGPH